MSGQNQPPLNVQKQAFVFAATIIRVCSLNWKCYNGQQKLVLRLFRLIFEALGTLGDISGRRSKLECIHLLTQSPLWGLGILTKKYLGRPIVQS